MSIVEENSLRLAVVNAAQHLYSRGLNGSTSGNIGVRLNDALLVTPSGIHANKLSTPSIIKLDFAGQPMNGEAGKPTSEWRMHRDILAARADINAVIHTHSMFATTLACLHKNIPPFHYMIAVAGGDSIRCAPYALFGSQQLSNHALAALTDRYACLLAHHGMIALGRDLDHALAVAEEMETLCEQYWRLLQIGQPKLLSADQMAEALEQFKGYGQWNTSQ